MILNKKTNLNFDNRIVKIFGDKGLLSSSLKGYEFRYGQLEMADAVLSAMENRFHLIVEAGTGVGKSLAYLIPAILIGKQVVVSTLTKTLQEQLYYVDIPFLQKELSFDFTASNLKGRGNYLCLRRYYNFIKQPFFEFSEEAKVFDAIRRWASETETGDRAEIDFLPDNFSAWSYLNSTTETCAGARCKQRGSCYFEMAKAKAKESDVIIVNHHLFFADLAMKKISRYIGVLPKIETIVFDEAHEIEEVATNYFGIKFSRWQLLRLLRETETELKSETYRAFLPNFSAILGDLDEQKDYFFNLFKRSKIGKKRLYPEDISDDHIAFFDELQKSSLKLTEALQKLKHKSDELKILAKRWKNIFTDAKEIMACDKDNWVYWTEQTKRNIVIGASPIELATELSAEIFERIPTTILTSATLSTNGNFDFLKSRIGIENAHENIVESPFNYTKQALIYVPPHAPDPRNEGFDDFVIRGVKYLLNLTEGKAFVLFTSRKRMYNTYDTLKDELSMPAYIQGEQPKHILINAFKNDINSVLFATSSFWHGVDVVGPSLSCVIIDKIPFFVPDEPVIEARIDYLKKQNKNAFMEFMVPSAIIHLKQGFGRLIRSKSDLGIIALFDRRFVFSSYGKIFQKSMPPAVITSKQKELQIFAEIIRNTKG